MKINSEELFLAWKVAGQAILLLALPVSLQLGGAFMCWYDIFAAVLLNSRIMGEKQTRIARC